MRIHPTASRSAPQARCATVVFSGSRTPALRAGAASVSAIAFSFLLLASCDGSSNSGGNLSASGVDSSKRLTTLTDAERGQLCDWMVPKVGSYGTPPACPGPFLVYPDQAACIVDSPDETETDCLATVAQLEACVNALPACATLADVSSTPACAAVLAGC